MKRALQGLLVAGEEMKGAVLDGTKEITIRYKFRDYTVGPVLIGCHLINWAAKGNITDVQHKLFKDVTEGELKEDGFSSHENALDTLRQWYPDINMDSEVTVIRFNIGRG